jgi:type IV secretion system protein VirD4
MFALNRVLSDVKVFSVAYSILAVIAFLLLNYILHYLFNFRVSELTSSRSELINAFIFEFGDKKYFYTYIGFWVVAAIYYVKLAWDIRVAHEDINAGLEGTDRWSEREEIKDQYREIPDCGGDEEFTGEGGFPIAPGDNDDTVYIDDSATNNLIVGTTRSGKDQITGNRVIDINSRAKRQASLVILDPKLEAYATWIRKLQQRGYEVHILNLIDPEYSMGYNPVTEVIRYYKEGDIPTAQLLMKTLATNIYEANVEGTDSEARYFVDTSAALLSALSLALTNDMLQADDEVEKRRQALIAKEGRRPETLWPAEIPREPQHRNEKKINISSASGMFTELQARKMLDDFFMRRPQGDIAKKLFLSASIAGERQRGNVYSNMLAALTVFDYDNIKKMTAKSTLDMRDVGFGKKPIAIFIGLPDYDTSNAFIASTFITQLYFVLAKMATHAPGGKCPRRVIFNCNEFGSLPPLGSMQSYMTVCLSRNMRFNLYLQSYEQLLDHYSEPVAKTIEENCGNHMWILSNGTDSAEKFSKMLGNRTVTKIHRTGRKLALKKELTEIPEKQPLMFETDLMNLMPGETIVCRATKREDLRQKGIRAYPIKNVETNKFRYTYRYHENAEDAKYLPYDSPEIREIWKRTRELQLTMVEKGEMALSEVIPEEPQVHDVEVETIKDIDIDEYTWLIKDYIDKANFERKAPAEIMGSMKFRSFLNNELQWSRSKGHGDLIDKFMEGTGEKGYQIRDIIYSINTNIELAQKKGNKKRLTRLYGALDVINGYFDGEHKNPEEDAVYVPAPDDSALLDSVRARSHPPEVMYVDEEDYIRYGPGRIADGQVSGGGVIGDPDNPYFGSLKRTRYGGNHNAPMS